MIKERLAKLINVKSIITILICLVFCFLCIKGVILPEQFLTIFTVIISFYFGTQYEKKNKEQSPKEEDKDDSGGA